jgi:signal transduction histidine kinase
MKQQPIRLLLLEGNPSIANRLRQAVSRTQERFEMAWVCTLADALAELKLRRFDAALVDLAAPDCHGVDAVAEIRQQESDLPILVLTSHPDDERALEAIDPGAQDFLAKDELLLNDAPEHVLARAIRYAIHRQQTSARMLLLTDRLQSHQKLVESKNRRLARLYRTTQRFVDNVSHEFRTPLTVIKEYVSLLRDGLLGSVGEEQCKFLDVVADRAEDLNRMVDDMLDVSKLDAGLLRVSRTSCTARDILHHVMPSLERKAAVKGVRLEVELSPDLPPVYCDADKAGRVIINLAVNAIKFCGQGGVVQLWARLAENGQEVAIGVTDNGPGIEPRDLQRIFGRFQQIDGNRRDSTKGFGLGLCIARELVHLNFGAVEVESEPGQGSTFRFTLPVDDPVEVMRRFARHVSRLRHGWSRVSLVTASAEGDVLDDAAEDVDAFLSYVLRPSDLRFQVGARNWLLALPGGEDAVTRFCKKADRTWREANRNRPRGPLPRITFVRDSAWSLEGDALGLLERVEEMASASALFSC